jgi:hypothetical protein
VIEVTAHPGHGPVPSGISHLVVNFGAPARFLHSELFVLLQVMNRCIAEKKWRAARQAGEEIDKRLDVLNMLGESGIIKTCEQALRDVESCPF